MERDERARLVANLPKGYGFLSEDPDFTIRKRGYVFLQDPDKVRIDVLLADTPFDVAVIERAHEVKIDKKTRLRMCTAEDLIIYKMITTRGYDIEDVKWTLQHQGEKLDDKHIIHWLEQFEEWLADSTLVARYKLLRQTFPKR